MLHFIMIEIRLPAAVLECEYSQYEYDVQVALSDCCQSQADASTLKQTARVDELVRRFCTAP